jgi:hypothetical protein
MKRKKVVIKIRYIKQDISKCLLLVEIFICICRGS